MTYAALITHVQPDDAARPRLACAIELAGRFDAALIGVAAETIPATAYDEILLMESSASERLKHSAAIFTAATARMGDRAVFLSGLRMPTPAVAAASRAADLVVAGGASLDMSDTYISCSTAELTLAAGRPVLVAPPTAPSFAAEQILLAWKDTREARRALSDSLPFLERAKRVVVVQAASKSEVDYARAGVGDVAAALRRRGVAAEANVVERRTDGAWEILRQASLEGAGLIVCGAYGHSRAGEWVFGGVTRDLLAQDQTYVLLSH